MNRFITKFFSYDDNLNLMNINMRNLKFINHKISFIIEETTKILVLIVSPLKR